MLVMRFDNEDMFSGTSVKKTQEGILEADIVVVLSKNNEVNKQGNPRDMWKRFFRSNAKSNIIF